MKATEIFEVEFRDVYNYRFSYGGQSSYFRGLEEGKLTASKCTNCGFVWCPPRPICSKCYCAAEAIELSGEGEIVTSIELVAPPPRLKHVKLPIASALVKPDGADTCIKAMVVSKTGVFARGTRVRAKFMRKIKTIADFYFVTF